MQQGDNDWRAWQKEVIAELNIPQDFDEDIERERRVTFLSDYLIPQGLRTYVLGSVGVSTLRLPAD